MEITAQINGKYFQSEIATNSGNAIITQPVFQHSAYAAFAQEVEACGDFKANNEWYRWRLLFLIWRHFRRIRWRSFPENNNQPYDMTIHCLSVLSVSTETDPAGPVTDPEMSNRLRR